MDLTDFERGFIAGLLISAGSMLDARWLKEKKELWLGQLRTT